MNKDATINRQPMKTLITLSILTGVCLCLLTLWTAKQIAKATMPRIEITQNEIQ